MSIHALAAQARNEHWLLSGDAYSTVMDSLALGDAGKATPAHPLTTQGASTTLPVYGPLLSRDNILSKALGWPSYDSLSNKLRDLEADSDVSRIILSFDSPGGQVSGVHELAQQIKAASKPIDAYVSGTCASAAYWLASQCRSITVSATAIVGSIGVRTMYTGKDPRSIVAKTSPRKNMSAQDVQDMATALNEVFITGVAYGRGVSIPYVKQNFGQGGVFVGQQAANIGMVDSVGQMRDVVSGTQAVQQSTNAQSHDTVATWDTIIAENAERQSETLYW